MRGVHEWFLHRGLPLVLTRRVRSRALIERSAPMVSGIGAAIALTMTLAELTDGDPDFGYAIRLGVLTLLLIAAPFALYLLHRAGTTLSEAGRRWAALLVMALFVFGLPFAGSGFSGLAAAEVIGFAMVAVIAIWLTYLGIGSIVLWAFRFAWVQVGALGTLMSRALPLLMLTVLVYFTGELWQLSARMSRDGFGRQLDSSSWWRLSSWSPPFATRFARCGKTAPNGRMRPPCWRARRWRSARAQNRLAPRCRWPSRSTSSQ